MTENRPRNAAATRQAILDAARQHFLKDGYDNAGLRAIAADAGIDAALISRYFGSKKQLFAEVLMQASRNPMDLFTGDRRGCGERVAQALLSPSTDKTRRMLFIGLVTGASASPEASLLAHEHIEKQFILPVSDWLGGERAYEKAWLISSVLMGSAIMNNIKPACTQACSSVGQLIQNIIDQ